MKRVILFMLPIFIITSAFVSKNVSVVNEASDNSKIEWLSIEEAVAKNAVEPRMIFIDFYNDWNEWSKKMDKDIYPNPQIISAMSGKFYAVKFNAESDKSVTFKGKTYVLDKSGRDPEHEFARELATNNDRLGYPTFVVLDKELNKLKAFQGLKTVDRLKQILDYYGSEENYKNKTWIEFIQETGF